MSEKKYLHLAIIPDGNRRWARQQGLLPWQGHQRSAENFDAILQWCASDPRISVLTFWAFSTENWKRDAFEVKKLMELMERYLRKERLRLKEKRIHLVHSGRKDRLSPSIATLLSEIEEETRNDPVFTFHIALDYGGKDEVVRAIQKLQTQKQGPSAAAVTMGMPAATEEDIHKHLDHPELPDIDLIIRTSGEQRTSNFFLWQSAYAEWLFLEKHFPDLTTEDIDTALKDYAKRKRRFGT